MRLSPGHRDTGLVERYGARTQRMMAHEHFDYDEPAYSPRGVRVHFWVLPDVTNEQLKAAVRAMKSQRDVESWTWDYIPMGERRNFVDMPERMQAAIDAGRQGDRQPFREIRESLRKSRFACTVEILEAFKLFSDGQHDEIVELIEQTNLAGARA